MVKHYLKLIALPVLLLVIFTAINFFWRLFSLPSPEELLILARGWFDLYGLPIVFFSSILEGTFLLGGYFPGAFVIVVGVILADTISEAVSVVAVAALGFMFSHTFNYILGRYGWYQILAKFGLKAAMQEAEMKLKNRGPFAILASYWMPSLAALTDTAAGIMKMPFRIFALYSFISTILWGAFAGTVVYILGERAISIISPSNGRSTVLYVIIGVWIALLLLADYWERKDGKQEQ